MKSVPKHNLVIDRWQWNESKDLRNDAPAVQPNQSVIAQTIIYDLAGSWRGVETQDPDLESGFSCEKPVNQSLTNLTILKPFSIGIRDDFAAAPR
jgi:hypothetical protein